MKKDFIKSKGYNKPKKDNKKLAKVFAWVFLFVTFVGAVLGIITAVDRFIVNADEISYLWNYQSNMTAIPICYSDREVVFDNQIDDIEYYIGADFTFEHNLQTSTNDNFVHFYSNAFDFDSSILYSQPLLIKFFNSNYVFNVVNSGSAPTSYVTARSYIKSYDLGYITESVGDIGNCHIYFTIQQFNAQGVGSDTPLQDLSSVTFGVIRNTSTSKVNDLRLKFTYSDSVGRYIEVYYYFSTSLNYFFDPVFVDRTYYLSPDIPDSVAYRNGYDSGYSRGSSEGYTIGYQRGYEQGEDIGYENGKTAGISEANDYSFLGLMGAVVDAPITALSGLLNFNFLGINLLSFLTGLITLALIIFVIRIVLGGK